MPCPGQQVVWVPLRCWYDPFPCGTPLGRPPLQVVQNRHFAGEFLPIHESQLMKSAIQFADVSKKYNLGLTRTSLPSILSQSLRKSLKRTNGLSPDENILWALRNVSFELDKGRSQALIGSNGAGKTTILKLLANITKPTSGRVTANGKLSALIELGAGFHPD